MNMIIEERRPIASERTRVFASDLVAVARVHQALEASTEQMCLRPEQAVRLAKLALDVGDLTGTGIPAELVLAVAAVGIKPPHELAAFGMEGLLALCSAGSAFADARSVWLEHMERGPDRRTPSVLREHRYEEALAASLPPIEDGVGEVIPFRGRE